MQTSRKGFSLNSYCYGLDLQPASIAVSRDQDKLYLQDTQACSPTQSPTLQLLCLAHEHHIPVQAISRLEKNLLIVEKAHWAAFFQLLQALALPVVEDMQIWEAYPEKRDAITPMSSENTSKPVMTL